MAEIATKFLIELLRKNYPSIFTTESKFTQIEVSEFSQGFMNHVLKISLLDDGQNKSANYVGIFFNANRYCDEESAKFLEEIDCVAGYLRNKGLPVRTAINTKVLTFQHENKTRFFSLFEFLPGDTISWEAYTRRHLRSLGLYLGKMHSALKEIDLPLQTIKNWNEYIVDDANKLRSYLKTNSKYIEQKLNIKINVKEVEKTIYEVVNYTCPYEDPELLPQLIHCDFVRGNVLFSNIKSGLIYKITGILDFEKMLYGKVEIDVARTLAFLFVDCKYKTQDEIIKYFLNEGYNTLGCADPKQQKVIFSQLEKYMLYFWLRDFWKYLECNPYEDLGNNEHFIRTSGQLVKYGIILFFNSKQ
jgi:Ser/Thr protein kinase RdoA (MazF antagonist)